MEIFIEKFDRKDREAMRDMATESKQTIGGLHLYACKNLMTWFRYGEWVIKWDHAVWVLGLTEGLSFEQQRVRFGMSGCNIDLITKLIISKHGKDFDLADVLFDIQRTITDTFVERAGRAKGIDFDYKRLLKEPMRYQRLLRHKLFIEIYGRNMNEFLYDRDNYIYWNCHCSGKGCEIGETCSRTELFKQSGRPEFNPMKTVIVRSCIAKNHKYYLVNPLKKELE